MPDKAPKFEVIEQEHHPEIFRLLYDLVAKAHPEIAEASIGLAWINNVKPKPDGHTLWGRAKRVGSLERQFHEHDFIILLNRVVWIALPPDARRALLDHELYHCGSKISEKTGETTWISKRHDVEEFVPIVRRYGLWREDVKALVNAALKREQAGLFDGAEDPAAPVDRDECAAELASKDFKDAIAAIPGVQSVTVSMGDKSVTLKGGAAKS